ncbi:hypothetical protein NP493_925g02016 [Ridgeia piscesae]|uniref:Uncharacterized protein n=1 Tax=Ridgeia piscesae TaxID=27915 RepID=A0AAD9NLD6_RIDPI|nr:hypothetical protein NP493_925g02016 [Ridgeia piscesae]
MCTTKGSGKCDTAGCKTGYKLKADFTACEACPAGCSFCTYDATTSQTKCILGQCDGGFVMKYDGTCLKCPIGCAACSLSADGNTAVCLSGKCKQSYVQATDLSCKR